MTQRTSSWRSLACALSLAALGTGPAAQATVVEIQTVLGNFQVNLFDGTPPVTAIATNAPVLNEPFLSNVRGTISMAKVSNAPNSATSQWFINLQDNSGALDSLNSGFTVFGIVLDDGMDVVDAIAALPQFNFFDNEDFGGDVRGALAELPLRDYDAADGDPDSDNLIIVSAVVVTDTTVSTNVDLLPPENPLQSIPIPTNNGGGGATGVLALIGLGLIGLRRRFVNRHLVNI